MGAGAGAVFRQLGSMLVYVFSCKASPDDVTQLLWTSWSEFVNQGFHPFRERLFGGVC